MIDQCRLCGGGIKFQFSKLILMRHSVSYFSCDQCDCLQTEKPFWLDEAYQLVNERFDTGQVFRSLNNAGFIDALVNILKLDDQLIVDFGCGSGLMVRVLRDVGLNAVGYDSYSEPRLCIGFHVKEYPQAAVVNLCEVAEHFESPAESLDLIFSHKPKLVIVQTAIFSELPAQDWTYLSEEHGQHIFFYSIKGMEFIANKYGYQVLALNGFIVFLMPESGVKLLTDSFQVKAEYKKTLDNSLVDLLNRLLSFGYKFPALDNQLLRSS